MQRGVLACILEQERTLAEKPVKCERSPEFSEYECTNVNSYAWQMYLGYVTCSSSMSPITYKFILQLSVSPKLFQFEKFIFKKWYRKKIKN